MLLQPKNWAAFQHYKDRSPPWIKLHRALLIDREFMCLPLASKALAPMLWLLASEAKDGIFDASKEELIFRLHINDSEYEKGIKPLISKGFFIVADKVLAERLHNAIPETETETETEREAEKETKTETKLAVALFVPEWIPYETWQEFISMRKRIKRPPTDYALKLIIDKLEKFRAKGQNIQLVLEKSITSGWQDVFEIKESQNLSKTGQTNQTVMSGLTRGLIGGGSNVKLLSR